jgi:predicted HicB family RNase H-like nuclease
MTTRNESKATRNEGIKRLGGNVPEDLHTRAKVAAATRRIDLTDWLIEAVEEKLASERRRQIVAVNK